jgi:hypothetical protein
MLMAAMSAGKMVRSLMAVLLTGTRE